MTVKSLRRASHLACAALLAFATLIPAKVHATVRLPAIFGSHMVLQQGKPIVLWGWADPGEAITVSIGTDSRQTVADTKGEWRVTFPARKAGEAVTVKVSGSNTLTFDDVLIGEVWLASGQSNMEMGITMCQNGKEEAAAADHPQIRLFLVANRWTPEPRADLDTNNPGPENHWKVCSPQTIAEAGWGGFSAAAYYFGRELQQNIKVPVGLIDATWGGTRIESWTPPEGFAQVPALQKEYERVQLGDARTALHQERLKAVIGQTEQWVSSAQKALADKKSVSPIPTLPAELLPPNDVQHPTALYNGMIHPVQPFAVRGFIWYQGESNLDEGRLYAERMKALIQGWREVWSDPSLPFYYVQIAPYNYGGNAERMGVFWTAQTDAQSVPNSGMVVVNDIGNLKDIHPANKQDVGKRLAAWALAKQYGKNVVYSGPTYKSLRQEANRIRVTFDHAAGGLKSRDGKPLTWFEIIDADEGGFKPAQSIIEGDSIVLWSPEVAKPVAVRFAWSMLAEPNLMNGAGLPAGAFQAGEVPQRDFLGMHVPEAKQYKTVYELDLSKLGNSIRYEKDERSQFKNGFDRIGYYLELQNAAGESQSVFVSMNAFTDSLDKIGIPTFASGARFQQNVSGMNVYSNVKGVVTGTNIAAGNIEFWPDNYAQPNSAKVPNASNEAFDFGDEPRDPRDGYGSMQVHNYDAKQTIFAINHWREGDRADIGIGNRSTGNTDWTFAANAKEWTVKRLRILVRPK